MPNTRSPAALFRALGARLRQSGAESEPGQHGEPEHELGGGQDHELGGGPQPDPPPPSGEEILYRALRDAGTDGLTLTQCRAALTVDRRRQDEVITAVRQSGGVAETREMRPGADGRLRLQVVLRAASQERAPDDRG